MSSEDRDQEAELVVRGVSLRGVLQIIPGRR